MKENVPSNPLQSQRRPMARSIALLFFLLAFGFTLAQPVLVDQITTGSRHFVTINGTLYFAVDDALYKANSTAGSSQLVANVGETILSISNLSANGKLFFITQTGSQRTLWVSDGTAANTLNVATYNSITPLVVYQSELYLGINDGTHGYELWKLSSSNGLSMVKDVNPGSGNGLGAALVSNNILYFSATSGSQAYDLWKTDGTSSGTVMAVDMPFQKYFYGLTDVDGTIYFIQDSVDDWSSDIYAYLWTTQGTPETTTLVEYFDPDRYNTFSHFTAMNGKFYFVRDYSVPDHYLWVSDGTEAGTHEIKRVERDGGVVDLDRVGDQLAFYTQSQSFPGAFQRSDGTEEGTVAFYQMNQYFTPYSPPNDWVKMTATDDMLYFIEHSVPYSQYPGADDAYQIFQSDLTTEGTKPLKELYDMSFAGTNNIAAAGGNTIFFTTSDSENGMRLWYYNPEATCAGTGGILRNVWNNVPGATVSAIPVNTPPSYYETLSSFQGPTNAGDRYGSQYRGYLCVSQSGNYRFWIASNDNSELWLSTTASPDDKVRIAWVNGSTNPGQYNKYATQQSALIHLEQGHRYYIEALHKEGVGSDHLAVGMQYPDGTLERPIQGARLIPYSDNVAPLVTLTSPEEGTVFNEPASVTIEADASDVDGTIAKVEFYGQDEISNQQKIGEDETAPYTFTWNSLSQGTYRIQVKAIDNEGLSTLSETITITVTGCQAAGNILWEIFPGYPGSRVSDVPWDAGDPFSIDYLTIFEGPSNIGDQYGSRMRGYLCPPATGTYVFYIASNDHSELWLSQDSNPDSKIKIASVTGSTNPRQWNKFASQRSVGIYLRKGVPAYIEALHKEGVGSDHLAVGWVLPDGTSEMPIPGSRLSPYENWGTESARARTASAVLSADPEVAQEISLSPNPAKPGPVTLTLTGYNQSEGEDEVTLDVVTMLGQVVNVKPITCKGDCANVNLDITRDLSPGVYIIKGSINNKRFSERLIIQE